MHCTWLLEDPSYALQHAQIDAPFPQQTQVTLRDSETVIVLNKLGNQDRTNVLLWLLTFTGDEHCVLPTRFRGRSEGFMIGQGIALGRTMVRRHTLCQG